jgi:chromate reductase
MSNLTLLGLPGALRAGSTNRLLLRNAARLMGDVTYIEADLRLPLFDADVEAQGIPAEVTQLAGQIAAADAVVISTPEYNKALSGVLKNALDWVSRTPDKPWAGKPVALMSAAAGRSGGERALSSLVLAMMPFRARLVAGPEICLADARNQFDADGRLVNERAEKNLGLLMEALRAAV